MKLTFAPKEKKSKEKDSKEKDSKEDKDFKGDKPPEPPAEDPPAREPVPYKKIQDLFLELCLSYPAIRAINGQRKKAVAARWNEHKDIKVFEEVFRKAEASSFLKGRNDRNWRADFDWMMKPTNFVKILEGRYQDKNDKPPEPPAEAPTLTGFKMAKPPEDWPD